MAATEGGEEGEVLARRESTEQHGAVTDVQRGAGDGARAAREGHETGEGAEERRLSRAVRSAEQREAGADLQGDPPQDRAVVEHDRGIVQRCGGHYPSFSGR